MSTIREITPRWKSYEPSGASNVTFASIGTEKQIRWGVALEGGKSGLGFAGSSPPQQQISIGTEFDLGTLRYFNTPIAGTPVAELVLELTIVYKDLSEAVFDLELEINNTADTGGPPGSADEISTTKKFPITITVGGTKLKLLGFRLGSNIEDKIVALEDLTTSAVIVAELVSTPKEEEHCVVGGFDPVFQPDKCTVPPVCPISTEPIVNDCGIPVSPGPITDCPEIDIPSFAGIADAIDGLPGPPGPKGCTPLVTVSYQTVYVHDCSQQRISAIQIQIPPCDVHLHFILYSCRTYYHANNCCVYMCCNGAWQVLEGGSWCQLPSPYTTTTTPYPNYAGPQIILAPASDCEEDGVTITKCPCEVTTTPQRSCVEIACGIGSCNLLENIMSVQPVIGDCICEFEDTATYDGSKWVTHSTNCAGDYISLSCYSAGSGSWQMVVNCNGNLETSVVDVVDNGDGTCSLSGTFSSLNTPPNNLPDCCPTHDHQTITFTGIKCQSGTTPAPPDCVETRCNEDDCKNIPGVIELLVGSNSGCSWPTIATYNSANGCWEAAAIDCSDGKVSICCIGNAFAITLTENGVTDTITAAAFSAGSCFIQGTFSSPPFPAQIGISARYDWCIPPGTTPAPTTCVSTSCSDCDTGFIGQYLAQGTITISGGNCCSFVGKVNNNGGDCWESQQLNCPDVTARVSLCCHGGSWSMGMSCGGDSAEEHASVVTLASDCLFEANFDSSNFSSCCGDSGFGDVNVQVLLTRCCTADRKVCYWTWQWIVRPGEATPPVGHWVLEDNSELCTECYCFTKPPIPANPFEGQTATTEADC